MLLCRGSNNALTALPLHAVMPLQRVRPLRQLLLCGPDGYESAASYSYLNVMLDSAGAGVSGAVCADTKLASQRATDSCAVPAAALPTAACSVSDTYYKALSTAGNNALQPLSDPSLLRRSVVTIRVVQLSSFN
jgi:hypothetical protein